MKTCSLITLTVFLLLTGCRNKSATDLIVTDLKCYGITDTVISERIPVFGWVAKSSIRGQIQTAYQIVIRSENGSPNASKSEVWNSGKILSDESTWIKYAGPDLKPGMEYSWKVRIWDLNDIPSEWSATQFFITGLFDKNDWHNAKWIGYEDLPDSLLLVPGVHGNGNNLGSVAVKRTVIPYFRREFKVEKKISHAFVFISGLGQYELYINGDKIGDRFLSPGWTDYRKRCLYNTFDVTEKLNRGSNVIGTIVGNGFYNINRERYRKLVIAYGAPKMILQLKIIYSDGSTELITSDTTWKTSPSPITYSGIYGGEDYDARLEQAGWNEPGSDDSQWKSALIVKEPTGTLHPEKDYPVTVAEVINYKKISFSNDSLSIYDFGQNTSGIIRIRVKGERGAGIKFYPGELLGEDSLVTQKATGEPYYFKYILKGGEEEIWMPRFTYYGFRYIQAEGAVPLKFYKSGKLPVIKEIQLMHTRNSSPEIGRFRCSDELFNSIYELIDWSIKSNLASVATDCPHREKLGWLEQTHLMGNSIKFIYDIHNLYDKVIDDMIEAQLDNGLVPDIAPEYVPFAGGFRDSPEWGSACIILPWDLYEWYGDLEAVRKAYPMMKRYLEYLGNMSENHILSHGLGDWYDLGPKFPGEAQLTPKSLTATAIYYYDTKLLGRMATLLGENEDAEDLTKKAETIRKAFNEKFYDPVKKVYSTGSQTANSMPLFFRMPDDSCRNDIVRNLVKSINDNDKALTAGDIGYRYLLRTLEEEGQSELIYEMNSKTDVPGYGYQLLKGATSLTESWAALKYVSNNHMMLGHLMEWFFSGVGGIRQTPGSGSYKEILISPEFVGDLTWAETTFNTVHGEISSYWKIDGDQLLLKVKIPVNCSAIVVIPQADSTKVFESEIPVNQSKDVRIMKVSQGKIFCRISPGEYNFNSIITKTN